MTTRVRYQWVQSLNLSIQLPSTGNSQGEGMTVQREQTGWVETAQAATCWHSLLLGHEMTFLDWLADFAKCYHLFYCLPWRHSDWLILWLSFFLFSTKVYDKLHKLFGTNTKHWFLAILTISGTLQFKRSSKGGACSVTCL